MRGFGDNRIPFGDDRIRFEYSGDFLRVTRGRQLWCFNRNKSQSYSDMMLLDRLMEMERAQ